MKEMNAISQALGICGLLHWVGLYTTTGTNMYITNPYGMTGQSQFLSDFLHFFFYKFISEGPTLLHRTRTKAVPLAETAALIPGIELCKTKGEQSE
jgi:hypothetical protein